MSEMRDLQAEKERIEFIATLHNGQKHEKTYLETLAIHAIDRAIAAENNVILLQRQYEELKEENYIFRSGELAEERPRFKMDANGNLTRIEGSHEN